MAKSQTNQASDQNVSTPFEKIAEKRAVPGVLSFNESMSLLFMNPEAEALCRLILQQEEMIHKENAGGVPIPREIHELCEALKQELLAGKKDPEEVQLRRIIRESAQPLLLRGFLIPGEKVHEPRYLILIEKLGRRTQVPTNQAKRHFKLTDREHEIVVHLADGRTNREIAELLDISEHTVKEHIKHVLRKTESSTRTGILAQLLRYS